MINIKMHAHLASRVSIQHGYYFNHNQGNLLVDPSVYIVSCTTPEAQLRAAPVVTHSRDGVHAPACKYAVYMIQRNGILTCLCYEATKLRGSVGAMIQSILKTGTLAHLYPNLKEPNIFRNK
jgi:hypothetical protein